MSEKDPPPALRSLHPDSYLNAGKLATYDRLETDVLIASLDPAKNKGCLKTRPDGTILDGHHRVFILKRRGIDVDRLPREIIDRDVTSDDVNESPLG